MIAIVDYGMGNLRSVEKAFQKYTKDILVTDRPKDLAEADKIVLPGVGAFESAMRELYTRGLVAPLKQAIRSGRPYLGLCLGLQLLFEQSEESVSGKGCRGLGILPGKVKRFTKTLKTPHMGWNEMKFVKKGNPIFKGIPDMSFFYFVHSYYAEPSDKSVIAGTTTYGKTFASSVWTENIYATQFHPEKSHDIGLKIIQNFVKNV